ncbi:MAG: family 43 glycosylhydrolase [Pseudomonadota bacterium]
MTSRREWLKLAMLGGMGAVTSNSGLSAVSAAKATRAGWGTGFEGQRKADRGNDTFVNPVMAGDFPDPTILHDGDDYYMTFTTFESYPGLNIWHSRDLINWRVIGPAIDKPMGSVLAVDLCKHEGRYYIYIPIVATAVSTFSGRSRIFVVHAENMAGPWSEPIPLEITGLIDPGHIVGEDGHRYLFLSGVNRVRLSADGLAIDGPIEKVYDGWRYPEEWQVEAYALEGPKLLRRGEWFYMISAVGGTAGPATSHMVIAARSRSVNGPWENCPHNPIVRTVDAAERWWSRGHATVFEGPNGTNYMVYHGIENGYRSLGRQTLLEPIEWTKDGWFRGLGGDVSQPLRKPLRLAGQQHGFAFSDDFSRDRIGQQWNFHRPGPNEALRARYENGSLVIAGKGSSPSDSAPLAFVVGDHGYDISVDIELNGAAEGGLLLYFNERLYVGLALTGDQMKTFRAGKVDRWMEKAPAMSRFHLRIVNDRHVVTMYYGANGRDWTRHGLRQEVSGYHHNTGGELVSLRPALYAAGAGECRFRDFQYRAIGYA